MTKTIGILLVAAFAATAEGSPPAATITATRRLARSAANTGRRSYWPFAQRYSIDTFWPSMKPDCFKPPRSASVMWTDSSADALASKPITGIAGCCARVASGQATTPPSSDMNSRRLCMSPDRQDHGEAKIKRYHTCQRLLGIETRGENWTISLRLASIWLPAELFGDLSADFACRIGGGVDIDVVAARQEVGRLSIGQRRRSLHRACRGVGDLHRHASVRPGLRRSMEMRSGRGAGQSGIGDPPRHLL